MDLSQKWQQTLSRLIWRLSRFIYCPAYSLVIHAHYPLGFIDKVEGEQDSWIRHYMPLLIGVIAMPISVAVHHKKLLGHIVY